MKATDRFRKLKIKFSSLTKEDKVIIDIESVNERDCCQKKESILKSKIQRVRYEATY